jgi:hypothetical protein
MVQKESPVNNNPGSESRLSRPGERPFGPKAKFYSVQFRPVRKEVLHDHVRDIGYWVQGIQDKDSLACSMVPVDASTYAKNDF